MTGDQERLTSPEEMRAVVLAAVGPLPPQPTLLGEAGGLVLAQPVVAPFDLPRFANAAMDGFAVRSADTEEAPIRLAVVGRSLAGRPGDRPVGQGEAVAIATGAPLPPGADAVVPVETLTPMRDDPSTIAVPAPVPSGQHVRTPGEDVRAGETILDAGTVLGPGQLAAAAALGMRDLMVHPRPRVAVLPTGDEIRSPGEPLGAGQIYDAVSAPLALLIREVGALALPFGPAPDEPRALAAAVREAGAAADAVVTIGGVSVGPMDLICRLPGVGDEIRGFRLALRPAKPFAFGRAFGVPLFGLPGNPGAALVAFEELVRPALLAMLGKDPSVRPAVRATLAEPLVQKAGRLHLVRAEVWREGGRLWARAAGDQGAAMIHSLARAQAWAAIPPDIEELPAGAEVQVRLLVDVP